MPGIGAEILREAGMGVVTLPGGEIVPAAERGVIDGGEWVGGSEDLKLGFQEVWKYHYAPGMIEPVSVGELISMLRRSSYIGSRSGRPMSSRATITGRTLCPGNLPAESGVRGPGRGSPSLFGAPPGSLRREETKMKRIGFVGTGTMGIPMVSNLLKAGFSVLAYDMRPEALEEASRRGASAARSSAEAARESELVVTMLPSSSHVEAAYLGANGVLAGAAPGRLCVDMSTIDPATSRRVAERAKSKGVRFLDAPVSGAVPRAIEGTLTIMVGGDATDLEEARPVLAAMGSTIIHVGPVGSGEVAKLCNNLIAGVATVAVCEAFRLAEGFGVDPKVLTEVISKSSGNTWAMEHNHPVAGIVAKAASSRDYAAGFMTDLMAKDLGLAVNAARELRQPVFAAPVALELYRLASSHGLGRKDFSSIYTLLKPSSPDAPV